MGLLISKATQYGVAAGYWKINKTDIDWHKKLGQIFVAGFTTKQSRIEGNEPIAHKIVAVNAQNFVIDPEDGTMSDCYAIVKDSPEFSGATDDV